MQSINQIILDTINQFLEKNKDTLPADQTYKGQIIEVLGNKKYKVQYNDASREIKTANDITLSIGDTVHVVYPLGSETDKYLAEDVTASGGTIVSGFYTLSVDAVGNLYAYSADGATPQFEYDCSTGNMYVLTEVG